MDVMLDYWLAFEADIISGYLVRDTRPCSLYFSVPLLDPLIDL